MAVVETSQSAFASLPDIDRCRTLWPQGSERAWFADTSARTTGVLLQDADTGLWGYSVCQRSESGPYHRVALATDIPTADLARMELVATMKKL